MEQLQAEKERLLYDVQRRGRPLDDDDDRSAIRRGLLAGSSQREFKWIPYPPTDPSRAGGPTPSDSPPPSLPLGPPSSSESVASPSSFFAEVPTRGETELAAAASLADIATTWRADEAQHNACMVQVDNPAACGSTPPHTMLTPEQALEEACHCIQSAHTNTDRAHQVARTLAIALGAKRAELGTVKALHAVLLQVVWPTMENAEVCTATGASMSTFCKWRGRVHQLVRLHSATVPPPSSLVSASPVQCLLARQSRAAAAGRAAAPPLASEEALQQARDATVRAVALDIIYEAAAAATAELSAEVAAEVMWRTYFTHTFVRRH